MASKLRSRKSWREKLETDQQPKVFEMPASAAVRFGPGKMIVSCPREVDALIREIPAGELTTSALLREALALRHEADVACPISTGIFVRIAAEASEEDRAKGRHYVTPYWRVLTTDGRLNEKFPGGTACQAERLVEEGHSIEPGAGRKLPRIREFEQRLARFR